MGLFDFIKNVGEKLFGGDDQPNADALAAAVQKLGLPTQGVDIKVDGDTVKVAGKVQDQATKEKLILALGNVEGVARVDEAIETTTLGGGEAAFYTVKKGDTLSVIAKQHYGNANKYTVIFEANKPMLTHPDKIYPGQVLRLPAQTPSA
jgi:nucleoid-associated protein YgaU